MIPKLKKGTILPFHSALSGPLKNKYIEIEIKYISNTEIDFKEFLLLLKIK
tara:strand:+ start:653 stop:805 length:153 start_codon:yes stop_codon:yes gene_type:complete